MGNYDPFLKDIDIDDLEAIRLIEHESYKRPLSHKELLNILFGDHVALVAVIDHEAAGHLIALRRAKQGKEWFELHSLVVRKQFRRNMIGTTLMDELKRSLSIACHKIVCYVPENCIEACCFLRSNYFRVNEIIKRRGERDVYLFEYYYTE